MDNEAVLRRAHETQLIAEQQQWYVEKDTLQKALQEQQGIAFALQQQQQERISELEGQLQIQESCHSTAVTAQHETIVDLQDTIVNLQQQQQQLQQDLAEAFAYRQKCVVQKQRIQQMEKRLPEFQHGRSPQQAQVSGNDPIDLTKDVDRAEAKGADDAEVHSLCMFYNVAEQALHIVTIHVCIQALQHFTDCIPMHLLGDELRMP